MTRSVRLPHVDRPHEMKQLAALAVIAALMLWCPGAQAVHAAGPPSITEAVLFHGPTPTVDPAFPYYQGRSPQSIAEEISLRRYQAVHLVITSEMRVDGALIDAFHEYGIAVWGMVWVGGTYSTAGFPPEWPEWRQELITPASPDGFIYLSPYHPGFREWKKQAIANLITKYPLDGIDLVEAFFPNWNGLQSGVYGDIGPYAQEAFRQRFGEEPPNFTDSSHPRYFTKVPDLFDTWVQFRVDTVTDWLNELVNGPGGIRETRPDLPVATWTLATDWSNAMEKARVDVGEDLIAVVRTVKPDIHFLQTNWPDWLKADLPPDYVRAYSPYVEALRSLDPDLPIGIQADIGSQVQNRRDWDWISEFEAAAWETGFATSTMYEYHIGLYMYTEAPRILKVDRTASHSVLLSFNKRIDWRTARDPSHFTLLRNQHEGAPVEEVQIIHIQVDGNRVELILSGDEASLNNTFWLRVEGVTDFPLLRLLKEYPAVAMETQVVRVPPPPES